jgi:hypothetical protein
MICGFWPFVFALLVGPSPSFALALTFFPLPPMKAPHDAGTPPAPEGPTDPPTVAALFARAVTGCWANILWLGAGRRLGGCTFAAEQLSTCLPSRLCNHTPPKSHFLKSLRSLTRCGRGSPSVTSPRGLRSDLIHGERPGRAEMVASQLRMTRRQFAMFIIRGFLIRHGWEVRFNPILTPFLPHFKPIFTPF